MKFTKLTFLFCAGLFAQQSSTPNGEIYLGRPKLWPFAEARYLVAASRNDLKKLTIAYPADNKLDPNAIQLRELDTLNSSLAATAQFDQGALLKNLISRSTFQTAQDNANKPGSTTAPPPAPTLTTTGPTAPPALPSGVNLLTDAAKQALADRATQILGKDPQQQMLQTLSNLTDGELQLISRKLTLAQETADPNYELYVTELNASIFPAADSRDKTARLRWKVSTNPDACSNRLSATLGYYPADKLRKMYGYDANRQKTQTQRATDAELEPYIYEMTPVQSRILSSKAVQQQKSRSFSFSILSLIGLGGGLSAQKDQGKTSQVLTHQVFVAGVGKGMREFGWDIMPTGDEHFIDPGVYTAYAILAVPKGCDALDVEVAHDWLEPRDKLGFPKPLEFRPLRGSTDSAGNSNQHRCFYRSAPMFS